MKKIIVSSVVVFSFLLITSCSNDDDSTQNKISIVPDTFLDLDNKVLGEPSSMFTVNTTLEFEGLNYILLYAHNEGSISPNTASMSIDDGINVNEFILETNLLTNGVVT